MDWFLTNCFMPVFATAFSLVIFLLLLGPTRKLLGANSHLEKARPFFVMSLFIILLLGGIAPVIDVKLDMGSANNMEYVWEATKELQVPMISLASFLFGYCIVMTVLAASLGRRDD